MATINDLLKQIETANSLKAISEALENVASIRLRNIRKEVERNTIFFNEIAQIYTLIKATSATKNLSRNLASNKRIVSVLLTSNFRFYGQLNIKLAQYFVIETAKLQTERIIIGKSGLDFLNAISYFNTYQGLTFKRDLPSEKELNELILKVKDFNQILVFYPKFNTVANQVPTFKDIGGNNIKVEENTPESINQHIGPPPFILEPDLGKIVDFFETQIKTLLLEETFLETELARVAARLISTNQAEKNAQDYIENHLKLLGISKRSIINIRILESLTPQISRRKQKLGGKV